MKRYHAVASRLNAWGAGYVLVWDELTRTFKKHYVRGGKAED